MKYSITSDKFTVKYVEKSSKNEEITRSKNTRTGVLSRINNILQSSKTNAPTAEGQETQQQQQQQEKETERAKSGEQVETTNKNSSPEEIPSKSLSEQRRQQQPQKSKLL